MVDAGGVRLACRVSGRPGGDPVVVLHSLGRDGTDWEEVARVLGRRRLVYAPDLRGHGLSEGAEAYSFELMRDDLVALLEALGLERVSLVGHAAGGLVALLFAAKHPERVDRLVLEEVALPAPAGATLLGPPHAKDGRAPSAFAPLLAQWTDPTLEWAELDAVTAPTLLLAGGLGSPLPQDGIAATARRMANGRLVTIPSGHDIHTDRPVEYAATLDSFLPTPAY